LQALIGKAESGASRGTLLREAMELWRRSGSYAGSVEELTPLWADWNCAAPVAIGLILALRAAGGARVSREFASAHQLTLDTVRTIRREIASGCPWISPGHIRLPG
jgi:hypothetical protein